MRTHYFWTYSSWEGVHFMLGCDEWYRRTILIRIPRTTRAFVVPISRHGALYSPLFPDPTFERWLRVYCRK